MFKYITSVTSFQLMSIVEYNQQVANYYYSIKVNCINYGSI